MLKHVWTHATVTDPWVCQYCGVAYSIVLHLLREECGIRNAAVATHQAIARQRRVAKAQRRAAR
jgi:hypothetical protein